MTSSKLPRRPHAERPRPGERTIRTGDADLQNGWLGRHGTLTVTDTRIVFVPTILDTIMRARRREIAFERILRVEREPRDARGPAVRGRRPRMIVVDDECAYQFMVTDLDNWIDMVELAVSRHRAVTEGEPLTVVRDNHVNGLLQGDLAR